ncbi:MAG: PAS domain-containing protein [Pseudolabrys sp.]|nr:PAS domain-containing protein [Pseudolabrys sp.]
MLYLFSGDQAARDTMRFAEEKVGFGLWQVDLATGLMDCSPNTYRLLGLNMDSWNPDNVGPPLSFAIFETAAHPDDLPALAEIHHVLDEGLPFDREFRVIHRNGQVRALSIHGEVLVDSAGKRSRVIGMLVDITRHAEKLYASQIDSDRIRALIEGISGTIWTARTDGSITDFIMGSAATGSDPAKYLGANWQKMLHPDDVEKRKRIFEKAVATKTAYSNDYRLRDADGNYKWRRSYVAPMMNNDGTIREWVGLSLYINQQANASGPDTSVLTGAQIRAARGILNWSVRDLADRTGLSPGVIRRLEAIDGVNKNAAESLTLVKDSLSAGGVEFFVLPDGEAGVFPTRRENRLKIVRDSKDPKKISA